MLKRLENYLSDKSEIVYVFPAIPCAINFFLALVTGSIYIVNKIDYEICTDFNKKSDRVWVFLLGQIIILYTFLVFYSNILLEYIPKFRGLIWNFIFMIIWFIGSFVWIIIGIGYKSSGECTDSPYHPMALANIVIYFIQFGACILYIVILFIMKLRAKYKVQTKNENENVNEDKIISDQMNNQQPVLQDEKNEDDKQFEQDLEELQQ